MKTIYKLVSAFAILSSVICSCNKDKPGHSDHPFTIEISRLRADGVGVDIIPENNDFNYFYAVCPREMVDAYGESESEFIQYLDKMLKDIYVIATEDEDLSEFEKKELYNGAYLEYVYDLYPETEYYIAAYAYSGLIPDKTLTKREFTTPGLVESDISFSISLTGSRISVTPSNSDDFLCEFCDTAYVDSNYDNAFEFHEHMSRYYWEEGFFPQVLSKNRTEYDLSDWYGSLKAGDKFYLTASGYDNGINSDISGYLLTYNGSDRIGTVTPIEKAY